MNELTATERYLVMDVIDGLSFKAIKEAIKDPEENRTYETWYALMALRKVVDESLWKKPI